ncbi:MAG TPA: hypothetical protein VF700_03865 [Segetibacter sp.]
MLTYHVLALQRNENKWECLLRQLRSRNNGDTMDLEDARDINLA